MNVESPVPPADPRILPRYAGLTTFARLPRLHDVKRSDVVIAGVPFDSAVTYRPGARFGPNAIRAGSRLIRGYNPDLEVSPFETCQVVDAGDIPCNPYDISLAINEIEYSLSEFTKDGQKVVVLGGDHSIALPSLRSVHAVHGAVALVHFDAHLDTWDTYFGADITHGSPFRRAFEEGLLAPERSIHIGTRGTVYEPQDFVDDEAFGFSIVNSEEIGLHGIPSVVDKIHQRVGTTPTYISVDIDVLDPGHAPGTGTPEAGGMSSRELLSILRRLAELRIIGADIVEVAPVYDHAEITAIAAANIAWEFVSIFAKKTT